MKTVLITVMFLGYASLAGCDANAYDKRLYGTSDIPGVARDGTGLTREEMMIKRQVDKHPTNKESLTVAALDGDEPAIDIASSRTGLPDEFISIPKKPKGEIYGR